MVFDFFDFSFFSEFTALFPRILEFLPDDAFLIPPAVSVSVDAPAVPVAQALPLPVAFSSPVPSVSLISPVFYPSVLGLPAFPSAAPVVSTYVYNSSYLTFSPYLPVFPLGFSVSSAVSAELLSMARPAPLIPFSGFSSVASAFVQAPCFASVSRAVLLFHSLFL